MTATAVLGGMSTEEMLRFIRMNNEVLSHGVINAPLAMCLHEKH